ANAKGMGKDRERAPGPHSNRNRAQRTMSMSNERRQRGESMNAGTNASNANSQANDLHLQEVIRSAEQELNELLQRRAELMKRIGTIKQTLAGLANIFGDSVLNQQLLTFLDRNTA